MNYILLILIYQINYSLNNDISQYIIEGKFPRARLLSSGKYFIILDKGIYLFNNNFSLNKTIYNFTDDEIIEYDYFEAVIYEFENNHSNYLICINSGFYLYIYETNNNQFYNSFIDNVDSTLYSYDLIPYKFNDSTLQYIIIFIGNQIDNMNILLINFYLNEINISDTHPQDKNIFHVEFDDLRAYIDKNNKDYPSIADFYISCQKIKELNNKEILICFYYINIRYWYKRDYDKQLV